MRMRIPSLPGGWSDYFPQLQTFFRDSTQYCFCKTTMLTRTVVMQLRDSLSAASSTEVTTGGWSD